MGKKNYIYELMINNLSGQKEKVNILTDMEEEQIRGILNYDVELIGCKEFHGKNVLWVGFPRSLGQRYLEGITHKHIYSVYILLTL